jgi:hypothetical protein
VAGRARSEPDHDRCREQGGRSGLSKGTQMGVSAGKGNRR